MRPMLRYAAVGAAATALHYALLAGLVEFGGLPAAPSAALGAVAGAQLAYVGNRQLTFSDRRHAWWSSWWRFQLVAVGGALLSAGLVALGARLGVHYLAAQVGATLLTMLVTYRANARHTFG